ncbi:Histone-lysine N-methyltransferase NSD2 [Liparis tanakae]|uniref:Histone-lysine N-methyltransferase NSD2 n=1 Tax=Liparis tanakae TaxID=230148 RepID=A0A4Z2FE37_9TELE|nr:Histone-lysine N-methyltransferase NSD2 [Liparis tanakae]
MPEPADPTGMKQPPESPSARRGGGDASGEPALLIMDKAAAQLAATLQDGVLQKMAGHGHNGLERLKDLASRVLNGDQGAPPKLCAPEPPAFKGADAPATNGTRQRGCAPKAPSHQAAKQPPFEPSRANGTGPPAASEDETPAPEKRRDPKKRRGAPRRADLGPAATLGEPADRAEAVDGTGAADEPDLVPQFSAEKAEESPVLISFYVGDLVWTKVSGYPWWPCMVTTDPEFNNHIKPKQTTVNRRLGPLYHVQYFGDAPERGYIFEKNMVSFTGEDQYQELSKGSKQPASRVIHKKTAPSVPRKLQAQWNMGVIQAKEAFTMSMDERMVNFTFLYDDDGPHLNPCTLEKLSPKQSSEMDPETEARLSPDRPSPPDDPTAAPRSQDGTSSGEKTQAPGTKPGSGEYRRRGKGLLTNLQSKKQVKDPVSHKETLPPQTASQDPTTSSAPDLQAATVPPQRKKRTPRQAPAPTKTTRGRRTSATDPVKKRKSKLVSSTDDMTEPVSLPVSAPVKRRQRKTSKGAPADAEAQQPKRKRKTSKDAEKQDSTSEGTDKKQRRKKNADKDLTKIKKRITKSKAVITEDEEAEKPKRRRKRKQDGENETTPSKAKRRRVAPCPDPEGSGSEGRPDSPSDSLDGTKKGERKKEFVCQMCEQAGEDLVPCEGQCCGMFHLHCLGPSSKPDEKLLCQECSTGIHSCFTCKQPDGAARRCHVPQCGKFYHEACIRLNPLTVFDNKGFRCPLHACLSCHYGCRTKQKSTKGRLMRCLRCPLAYHVGDLCVAAGSQMITNTAIVCTNHFNAKKGYSHHSHVNVSWCFVCSKGSPLRHLYIKLYFNTKGATCWPL